MDVTVERTMDQTSETADTSTAVGLIFTGAGVTEAQYRQVLDQVSPGNQPAAGMLSHTAGLSANGMCVMEVWESQAAVQRFFDTHLGAALQGAGITVQPITFRVLTN